MILFWRKLFTLMILRDIYINDNYNDDNNDNNNNRNKDDNTTICEH
jgi:hypothetical protein